MEDTNTSENKHPINNKLTGNQNLHVDDFDQSEKIVLPILPCKPEAPADSDCCGSGCTPCVFDIYEQEVKIWEKECDRIKDKAIYGDVKESDGTSLLSELEYRKFTLTEIRKETSDSDIYRFHIPFNRSLGLKIGQHIIIRERTTNDTVTRQYTPILDVNMTGYFDLLIKKYHDGKMSGIVNSWKVGDEIEIRGPFGSWTYQPAKYRLLLMLAVGTGIAPMSQIIQAVLSDEDDETFVHLLYGCQTYKELLMKQQLDDWSGYWNFSVTYAISQETNREYKYGDKVFEGRIDENLIQKEINGKSMDKCMVLICGTPSFDQDMIQYSQNIGFFQNQIFNF